MRAKFLLFLLLLFISLILWVFLSGTWFLIALTILAVFIVISAVYNDTFILFSLGAREVKSDDQSYFYAAALQEAYKLAVGRPRLYFFNGALGRAFVLQNHSRVNLVLHKELLESCTKEELSALCFELLLQIKHHQAIKRTRVMYLIGLISWFSHSIIDLIGKILPFKEIDRSLNWLVQYLLYPWLEIIFKLTLGKKYFRKIQTQLDDYPNELDLIRKVGIKIGDPLKQNHLTSRKILEFSGLNRSRQFQNILLLEMMPHEWDLIFDKTWGQPSDK
jgi:hypothetical protein